MLYPIFENYMNQIKAILNRLYPLEERKPAQIKLALLFGLVVFGVLFLLNPFEDKLTLSVFMEIDHKGDVIKYDIKETIINSKARMPGYLLFFQ